MDEILEDVDPARTRVVIDLFVLFVVGIVTGAALGVGVVEMSLRFLATTVTFERILIGWGTDTVIYSCPVSVEEFPISF